MVVITVFDISWRMVLYTVILLIIVSFVEWKRRKMIVMFNAFNRRSKIVVNIGAYLKSMLSYTRIKEFQFPYAFWFLHYPFVVIGTPQDMKVIMHKTHDKGRLKRFFQDVIGNGLLCSTDEKWQRSRRLVNTAFTSSNFEHYCIMFNKYSNSLVEKIRSFADTGKVFDIWPLIARCNLGSIIDNMTDNELHLHLNENQDDRTNIYSLVEEALELEVSRLSQPFLYLDFIYKLYLKITKKEKIFTKIHDFALQNIKQKEGNINEYKSTLFNTLQKAHQEESQYTKENMKDDLMNVIGAGYATTARLISFTIFMLAIHQDIQDKVHREIMTVLGDTDEPIPIDRLNDLTYLEQCINETLRKYPPFPFTGRVSLQDIALNDDQTIPKNCNIIVSTLGLHWNENLYPNPEIWDPDRFTVEACDSRDKYAFLPFGAGPHMCPGAKYAMISTKIQIVHLIRAYQFETDIEMRDIQLDAHLVLKTKNGYPVNLRSRITS